MISPKNKEFCSKEGSSKSVSERTESMIESTEALIKAIKKSPRIIGRKQFLEYLNGKKLTRSESIIAMCYGCMGYHRDGRSDCGDYLCPLYPHSPSRGYIRSEPLKQEED